MPRIINRKWYPDWRTALSAALVAAALPPWNIWPLVWVCLVPWFSAIHRTQSWKEALIQGAWLSYFICLSVGYCLTEALRDFGHMPWIAAVFGLQIFALIGQFQHIVIAPVIKFLANRPSTENSPPGRNALIAISVALGYTGLDWFLPKQLPTTIGHCFYLARHLRQIADLGGPSLLTFLAFFVNDTVWNFYLKKRSAIPQGMIAGALCLASWVYGDVRLHQVSKNIQSAPNKLQAALIQANISDFDKVAAEKGKSQTAEKIIQTYINMSDQALRLDPRPDLIIWPETAYPFNFRKPRNRLEMLADQQLDLYARSLTIPLLFGGYDFRQVNESHESGRNEQEHFNAFYFVTPPNANLQVYRKSILLFIGEYIPGAHSFRFLRNAFPEVGNFARGPGPQVLEIHTQNPKALTIKAAPVICYEALFSNYISDAARHGSQIIINITNDSWFGNWGQPQLHMALAAFRSIETRLPMLRATNTGISALVLPDGEITYSTEMDTARIVNVSVPLSTQIPTVIKLWGDWFGLFALSLGLLAGLFSWSFWLKRLPGSNQTPP